MKQSISLVFCLRSARISVGDSDVVAVVADVAVSGGRWGTSSTAVPLSRNASTSTVGVVAVVDDVLGGVTGNGESGGATSTLAYSSGCP